MKNRILALVIIMLVFTIVACAPAEGDIMKLKPMKKQFSSYFMIGNIAIPADYVNGKIINERLLRHYNILTSENYMKPDAFSSNRSGSTVNFTSWSRSDEFVDSVTASGFKVQGHTLLWHSQIPGWQRSIANETPAAARALMESWITQIVSRYKGKIYGWDVLNELFPDSDLTGDWKTSMRDTNPWAASIGPDFVYYGFLAARNADPDAILYYNDYNMDNADKAGTVAAMVQEVNNRYASEFPSTNRKLIEGIGMQSHHNTGVNINNISNSLNRFRELGVKVSITELDVLSQTFQQYSASDSITDQGRTSAANLYGSLFKLFLQNSDIIERVTFWGVYDEQSWRSRGEPLIFTGGDTTVSKPAYGRILQALNDHKKK